MTFADSLGAIDIFRNLPPEDLAGLAELCTWSKYESHQEIVGYLDESRQVFFLTEGTARAIIYSLSGKEVTFRDIDAGEMFGEFAAIDGQPRSASVEALAPCLVATLSAERFWEVLRDHPRVAEATLQRLTRQIRALTERVLEFSTLAVKHRIHAELLRMAHDHMGDDGTASISPAPTHHEFASRISTHREAVTRELNHLTRTGLIERRDHRLIIRDVSALTHMVESVSGP